MNTEDSLRIQRAHTAHPITKELYHLVKLFSRLWGCDFFVIRPTPRPAQQRDGALVLYTTRLCENVVYLRNMNVEPQRLKKFLLDAELISEKDFDRALALSEKTDKKLSDVLVAE